MTILTPRHDRPIGANIEEWLFVAWTPDGTCGVISGHRLIGPRAWYWSAHVRAAHGVLHLAEWEVAVRPDPMVVKAPEMWAEHTCELPLQQWSIGNEAYFTEFDQPDEALGRGYGIPTATAFDLEWYATAAPEPLPQLGAPPGEGRDAMAEGVDGFRQDGVVHGVVEVIGRTEVVLSEVPARRWRRWTNDPQLAPLVTPTVVAHTGLRAPFGFPDGTVADWVLTPMGWRSRANNETSVDGR